MVSVFFVSILLLCISSEVHAGADKPNIVYFLTDDQDQMLGGSFPVLDGVTPMPKTKKLMADQGTTATNMFIHTPICNPSRSALLSGRYFHNIKQTKGQLWAMHVNETVVNEATFAKFLSEKAGYTVGMFGKYQNVMPKDVPAGFDAWLGNGGGSYIAPSFNTKNIDGLPDGHWKGTEHNYTTAVVGNISIAWIRKVAAQDKPFFAYIAPKACHEPFNPAPWYANSWDPSWPAHEPRPANWNSSAKVRAGHNGVIPKEDMLTEDAASVITGIFKNRWRTLMSVDDVIADVIAACEELGVLDNTYFFYSSDHGFQLGEFNILMDKRHVYDTNTRIHLLASGPGIDKGATWSAPATQVDLAPTFLGLAGLVKPSIMDGHSLAPFILTNPSDPRLAASTRRHLTALGDAQTYIDTWRDCVFIEYYYVEPNSKCVQDCKTPGGNYPHTDSNCVNLNNNTQCWGGNGCDKNCYLTESVSNNFIALRHMSGSDFGNTLYAEFQTGEQSKAAVQFDAVDFFEYYNVKNDPWQLANDYKTLDPKISSALHKKVQRWFQCEGDNCP